MLAPQKESIFGCSCITTHNPTLFVQLKVEPLEQWNPGPSFKTYQPQRAKFAAWNSGTNTAVYNFSRFQLTVRQNRGIRCIDQLEIVESACSAVSGFCHGGAPVFLLVLALCCRSTCQFRGNSEKSNHMLSATSHIGLEFLTKFLNMSKLQNRLILLYQSLPLH